MFCIFQIIMKLYIIITTLLSIESGIKFAVGTPILDQYMNGLHQFCGQELSKELSMLCMGRYNDPRGNIYSILFYNI